MVETGEKRRVTIGGIEIPSSADPMVFDAPNGIVVQGKGVSKEVEELIKRLRQIEGNEVHFKGILNSGRELEERLFFKKLTIEEGRTPGQHTTLFTCTLKRSNAEAAGRGAPQADKLSFYLGLGRGRGASRPRT